MTIPRIQVNELQSEHQMSFSTDVQRAAGEYGKFCRNLCKDLLT